MSSLPKLEDLIAPGTWNKRYRILSDLVHKGPEARKLVVQALTTIKENKDLSFGERKLLDLANNYEEFKKEWEEKVIPIERKRYER